MAFCESCIPNNSFKFPVYNALNCNSTLFAEMLKRKIYLLSNRYDISMEVEIQEQA